MQEGRSGTSDNSTANREQGGAYERLDAQEVEEARMRAQQPSVYEGLQRHLMEDLYKQMKKNSDFL